MVLVGVDVSHGNLKFETVISSVIKAYRDWTATPPLRPPRPRSFPWQSSNESWLAGSLRPAFYHGQPIMGWEPKFWWLPTPGKDRFPCCNAHPRMSCRLVVGREQDEAPGRAVVGVSGREIETGGGGRTMNAQECGPPPSCFSTLTQTTDPGLRPSRRRALHLTAWRLDNWLCIVRPKTSSAEHQWTRPLADDLSSVRPCD